ncbi:MAG: HEAT repeat domain-containing protein [Phycisphaerae bacterium]
MTEHEGRKGGRHEGTKDSIVNRQSSIVNRQSAIRNRQPPIVNRAPRNPRILIRGLLCFGVGVSGCVIIPRAPDRAQESALRRRAIEAVKRAVRYEHDSGVRALGIEVMQKCLGADGLPWLRNALRDDEPVVPFAALLALGTLQDRESYATIHAFVHQQDDNLKVAAYYALHRLGDTSYSARLPDMLLTHPSSDVRRSAAMVLGLLGDPQAVKLLARAMKDQDQLVQQEALEAMASLGNPEAIQQLTFSASSGMGFQRVSAINTLAALTDPSLETTFRYKLQEGEYLDTRLAGARALGLLGIDEGFGIALKALDFNSPQRDVRRDPPEAQIRRVRQLAAIALGAIGDRRALPVLQRRMNDQSSPWVQVVAADAILEILGTDPLAHMSRERRRGQREGA